MFTKLLIKRLPVVRQTLLKPMLLHQVRIRSFCMTSSYSNPHKLSMGINSQPAISLSELTYNEKNNLAMKISQEELCSIIDDIDTSPSLSIEPLWAASQMIRHTLQRRLRVDMRDAHYKIMDRVINMTEKISNWHSNIYR